MQSAINNRSRFLNSWRYIPANVNARARASEDEYKFNPDRTKRYASELPTAANARVIPGMVADNPVEAMQALMADPNTTRSVAEAATDARDLRERVGNPWHMGRRDRERMHAAQSERGRTVNALAQAYDGSLVQRGVNATSDALGSVVGTATKGVVLALSGVETVDEMVTLSRVYDETTGPMEQGAAQDPKELGVWLTDDLLFRSGVSRSMETLKGAAIGTVMAPFLVPSLMVVPVTTVVGIGVSVAADHYAEQCVTCWI